MKARYDSRCPRSVCAFDDTPLSVLILFERDMGQGCRSTGFWFASDWKASFIPVVERRVNGNGNEGSVILTLELSII